MEYPFKIAQKIIYRFENNPETELKGVLGLFSTAHREVILSVTSLFSFS